MSSPIVPIRSESGRNPSLAPSLPAAPSPDRLPATDARSTTLAAALVLAAFLVPVLFPCATGAWAAESGDSARAKGEAASTPGGQAILPPAVPWSGASRSLALAADSDDPWITHFERSGRVASPSYDETNAWLARLVEAAPELHRVSLGQSGEGRDIWMIVASADGAFTPERMRTSGKPVVLVQAGIHSGEIDGKDAGLMLLRDMTVHRERRHLLDRVQLLFVPILNVDGHERRSPYGRINQRGPVEMGWRTNARNLNLNRDYAKADTPEIRALLRALDTWNPDLYIDLHVTDGIDYQYDITWGYSGRQAPSPAISRWLETVLDPPVTEHLRELGHTPGYLVFSFDANDPDQGLFHWSASSPRYSDGYGALRHLPTILVENHSLDPYEQRVLGTYGFLEAVLATVGQEGRSLRQAIDEDRARRPETLATSWSVDRSAPPEQIEFAGVRYRHEESSVSGGQRIVWLGEPVTKTLPQVEPTVAGGVVRLPAAYWVPAPWTEILERLAAHGIEMERQNEAVTREVEVYRLTSTRLATAPFEGHVRVELEAEPEVERMELTFPAGSMRIPTDQPRGLLAAHLLEPVAPDSFFQWGFFNSILGRTEYVEAYVMEPMAERMLAEDEALAAEFAAALEADPEFAADPRERLQWFYRRTPFFDARWRLYPVGREISPSAP